MPYCCFLSSKLSVILSPREKAVWVFMAGWLASTLECNCKSSGQGLTPERVKDCFSVLQNHCIYAVIGACLAFMRTVRDYLWLTLKIQCPPFGKRRLTNDQWRKSMQMIQSHFQTCKLEPYIFTQEAWSVQSSLLSVGTSWAVTTCLPPFLCCHSCLPWFGLCQNMLTLARTKATLKWCCIMAWVRSHQCGHQWEHQGRSVSKWCCVLHSC